MSPTDDKPSPSPSERLAGDPEFSAWAEGQGVIRHDATTRERIADLLQRHAPEPQRRREWLQRLRAADQLANMGMWLVAHMTYARRVRLDGAPLGAEDFKPSPEGHTGGALNMVPAYVGYLVANSLTGMTRSWTMGQGHCVAAVDALNLLVDNMGPGHAERYGLDDTGLTRLVNDFYHCGVDASGRPQSPLGSHVNAHTAGGTGEGGYLGFAGLQYVHMPLPGQHLVAFLSDGAFEEQRGSDWAARWWRAEDSGPVVPVMIANGRRIDQRTTMSQSGGTRWFEEHLTLNGFTPLTLDGRDPAAFVWGILTAEARLDEQVEALTAGRDRYPLRLPYLIADTIKGFGFPGAGTNAAHNLPLGGNPAHDEDARAGFHEGAAALHVPLETLQTAIERLNNHAESGRVRERDHPLAAPRPTRPQLPPTAAYPLGEAVSPMAAIDDAFCALVAANPGLRVRVGNPDEMRSNRLNHTLDRLLHRVTDPEPGTAEALNGSVITALNEEAVVSAALANKQGLNLVASYEAFAVKMLGAMRQEILFARHQQEVGREPGWLTVPVLASSHTWENGKNEQSHQDPTLCEAWMGEMDDVAPTLFPVDAPSAALALLGLYGSRGRVAVMVVPKNPLPVVLTADQAARLGEDGILCLHEAPAARVQLFAIGAYQLIEMRRALGRLSDAGVATSLFVIQEPGKLREARDEQEAQATLSQCRLSTLVPEVSARVFLGHCRPEALCGVLRPLDSGAGSRFLGYRNRGGTLDTFGMLYANRATWAHVLEEACEAAGLDLETLLDEAERLALAGEGDPEALR
ncbi:xylulose 5-phosphate 3-epimerase [Halomonas campisalis]|uniref:Xylulose 5-phosphate 3-epimerase n=1 Tax=Billgrantia campisalis TaxID=74661 RepID=A0ABS9P5K4_9GAMM|nr:xylulose 5-phosphate 3-epimerase [Halomonas campisalis]MCG6656370.1 xylulose 5-phosphate 3-epimerase [Halomonas campisalis]MDR5861554.1 xylulose 5-phosphate 3-epimerase [Halomonas campisalis]